jgi:glutamate N-acetyltransferase/amino-acid N-acetyltransferase
VKPLHERDLPRGFRYSATASGLKKTGGLDLAMISAAQPVSAAAMFTTNVVQAAPVRLSRRQLRRSRGRVRAVVVNSGNANCATGPAGEAAARATARRAAAELGCRPEQVLVCSTGVIGVPLAVGKILAALPPLAFRGGADAAAFRRVARAIMTTDTRPKWASAAARIGGRGVRIAGCAKGAGMIHPRMATMLAFLVTDAKMRPALLQRALREAVAQTFNAISVDGDTSTNDTTVLLASGASGVRVASETDYRRFVAALENVCRELALAIVADGEGARHVVEVVVRGAHRRRDAEQVAATIATSPLVKTALAGADPNWGRILAAAGRAGVRFNPERATIRMAGIKVFARGRALPFDERRAHRRLLSPTLKLELDLGGRGKAEARYWTCDFTAEYVRINASYRT